MNVSDTKFRSPTYKELICQTRSLPYENQCKNLGLPYDPEYPYTRTNFLKLLTALEKIMTKSEITRMCGYSGNNSEQSFWNITHFESRIPPHHQWAHLISELKRKGLQPRF